MAHARTIALVVLVAGLAGPPPTQALPEVDTLEIAQPAGTSPTRLRRMPARLEAPDTAGFAVHQPAVPAHQQAIAPEPVVAPPPDQLTGLITVADATAGRQEAVDWAVAYFADAGLQLPTMTIQFHSTDDGCDGYDGAFRRGASPLRLDVCNAHPLIILHELAHAWDHHALTDESRNQFMKLRGLDVWNDSDTPWSERGVEQLADMVVWGLQQLRKTAACDERPDKELAFGVVTGIDVSAHCSQAQTSPSVGPYEDPADAYVDGDDRH